ncbi:MAG: CRISPR system precrRNA processing endoribonuclease RAMP protein Cas6 [Ignisphaera sp.]
MLLVLNVDAVVAKPVPLVGWSGSFLARLVKSYFPRDVVDCGFSVSPLLVGGRVVLSGVNGSTQVLDAGSRVSFRAAFFCGSDKLSSVLDVVSSGLGVFSIQSVDFRVYESPDELLKGCGFCSSGDVVKVVDNASRVVVDVFFGPTILVFRGWRVLFPSPQRIVFNLARLSTQYLGVDPRVSRRRARVLSRHVEVVGSPRTRVVDVFIGRGRRVKAFMGSTRFGVYREDCVRDFIELLELGKVVGVGKSRGIGFGYISYRVLGGKGRSDEETADNI